MRQGVKAPAASVAAVEQIAGDDRRCPRCGTPGAGPHGKTGGLRRYRCRACGRTFTAVTGTSLSGLHRKELWLAFGRSLMAGETLKVAAKRCGISPVTAFHWRRRFLEAAAKTPEKLRGIVDADNIPPPKTRRGIGSQGRPPRGGRKPAGDGTPSG